MSRGTRNFFAKLTHFFKQHFSSSRPASSYSNEDLPSAGPPPTLLPQVSASSRSFDVDVSSARPPSTPHPPRPPTLSSRPSTPLVHPPRTPPAVLSTLDSLLPLPASGSTPSSSALPASRKTPRFGEHTNFAGAHDFVINDPSFIDISLAGSGLKELLKNSMPDAFYNSAARYPPPKCHLGTREEYITKITSWAFGDSDSHEPILWMRGPFGVGKSAVAQSCAEALQRQNKLAATLFFSRSNTNRDDPRRVFTSIAYQIASLCEPFSNIVDARIRKDPAIATKSLSTQFEELLVRPLAQVGVARSGMNGCVVIIDGLDECRGSSEQCEIIRVIATSVRDRTTPFRWFITSRPEDPIIRTMKSPTVFSVSHHLELPVSRKIDHEILLYLTDEFNKIRESHGLAESWAPEEVLSLLVERAAGLWIYVTTIVRFITDEDSYGPDYQLRLVLQFAKDVSTRVGVDNPLAEMDFLYTLIMHRVPERIRRTVRDILLIHSAIGFTPEYIAHVLGLTEEQLRRSCTSLQSVMELQGSTLKEMYLHFYHTSFLDFMKNPARSKELCIYGDFLIEFRRARLDWLHQVCSSSTGPSHITFPSESVLRDDQDHIEYYNDSLICFWILCGVPNHPFDIRVAESLEKLPFGMMFRLIGSGRYITSQELQCTRDNLPLELRDKIIREDKCPTSGCTNPKNVWIFGHGENETVAKERSLGGIELKNNQDPDPGWCFCGSRIIEFGFALAP